MPVNYASKFSPQVDEAFALGSLSGAVVNNEFEWLGVEAVKVFSVNTVNMNNYTLTGTSRYGTPGELDNNVQTMSLARDRSFTFTIDKKSEQDTMGTMAAAEALARQIREVVIPEIDTYRFAKLVSAATGTTLSDGTTPYTGNVVTAAVTKANAYEEFLKVQEMLDEDKVPVGGRVCIATPAYINKIKLDEAFTKWGDKATNISMNGVIGDIDGVPVIKVPSTYLPADVDFIITNQMCAPSPMKLVEYKIHNDVPGISGSLVEGRLRYDCFVLDRKIDGIGVHKAQ